MWMTWSLVAPEMQRCEGEEVEYRVYDRTRWERLVKIGKDPKERKKEMAGSDRPQ